VGLNIRDVKRVCYECVDELLLPGWGKEYFMSSSSWVSNSR